LSLNFSNDFGGDDLVGSGVKVTPSVLVFGVVILFGQAYPFGAQAGD